MKNNIIYKFLAIAAITIASLSIFVACTEEDITDTNNIIKKSTNNEGSIIGYYDIDEKTFELNFSDIEFAQLYKDEVRKEHGIDVNVELVKIEDENPQNPEYYSYLMFRVYDIDNDCLLINMMELRKDYNKEDRKIYYCLFGSTTTLTCEATNCEDDECKVKTNLLGKAIGCTPCEKKGGVCKVTHSSTSIKWIEIATLVIAVIALFL